MEDNLFFVDTKGNAKNFNKTEQKKRKIEQDNEEEKSTKKGLTSRVVIGEDRDSSDEEAPSAAELQLAAKLFGDNALLSEQFGHELESRKDNEENESEDDEDNKTTERAPAWVDTDDNLKTKVTTRGGFTGRQWQNNASTSTDLRSQFLKVHGEASWATLPTEEQEEDAAIYRSTMPLLAKTTKRLPMGILEYNRMSDANHEDVSKADITTRFHPKTSLLLVGGQDNKLKLFQVDGVKNSKVAGVVFGDMPIRVAEFTSDGEDIIVTGRRKYYYTYNLGSAKVEKIQYIVGEEEERSLERFFISPDNKYITVLGKNGNIMMLSRQSKQLLYSLRMNDGASTAAFTADGLNMYTAGTGGTVYKWDLRTRRCVTKFANEGALRNTSLAVSPDDTYLATGDESGVINIYETQKLNEKNVTPFKSVTSLTTAVSRLKFNSQSQMLGASSTGLPNSFKMVHVPSFSAFSNWPPQNKFPVVSSFDFSPNSGFVAVGTNKGAVQVYKLNHYPLP